MANECRHRVRFTLSDESGTLRFKDFHILARTQCDTAQTIEKYLVEQPLADVNWEFLRQLGHSGQCSCGGDVLEVLDDCRRLFARSK